MQQHTKEWDNYPVSVCVSFPELHGVIWPTRPGCWKNSRKPGTSLVVVRKLWMPLAHVQLSFMFLDPEQKSSIAGDCELGQNENIRWMLWKIFMPY